VSGPFEPGAGEAAPLDGAAAVAMAAAAAAQRENARAAWSFVREVGLAPDGEGGLEAALVSFAFVQDGRRMRLTAPLLALLPVPVLELAEVEVVLSPGTGGVEQLRLRAAPAAVAGGMATMLNALGSAVQVTPDGPEPGDWLPGTG
jgi:Protein of unknown function (DUF2589)